MKKILITGGSGFIGTNLVFHLLKKNFIIFNLDKISAQSTPEIFKSHINKNYFFFKFDMTNELKLRNLIVKTKPSIIINLAAESHVDRSIDNPRFFIKNNIISNLNLLNVFKDYYQTNKSTKLIHISTDEVYGSDKKKIFNEKDSFKTNSPYSASKGSVDLIINSFIETYNLPICTLHLSNNYGPFQFIEKLIPKIITNYMSNKNIPIYGKGKNIREWLHVHDTCEAIYLAIKTKLDFERYNVGSGKKYSNFYLAKLILRILKNNFKIKSKSKIFFVKDRPGHDFRYAINSKKFKNATKWNPSKNLMSGLQETIKWTLNNNKWVRYTQKKYKGERQGKI